MQIFYKLTAYIFSVAFGFVFALWFNGSTLYPETRVNGMLLSDMTVAAATQAIKNNPESLQTRTFVSFWGIGNFWIDGQYIQYVTLLLFPILFLGISIWLFNRNPAR